MDDESPDAEAVRLRREIAELRQTIARFEGEIAGLRWLLQQYGIQELLNPDGQAIWSDVHNHTPGNA